MAFTVDLFQFQKRENSTKRPNMADASSFQCVLKDETGILNPQILLDIGISNAPSLYNYAYIQSFNRYYWIEEWINEGKLWRANLKVDTLATYKDDLGNQDFYMLRSASEWDGNVIDTLYPTKTTLESYVDSFEPIFSNEDTDFIQQGMFIVGVVAKNGTYGSIQYYMIPPVYMRYICNKLLDNDFLTSGDDGLNVIDASLQLQKSLIDPLGFIKSAIYLPFSIRGIGLETQEYIDIWTWHIEDVVVAKLGKGDLLITRNLSMPIRKHPQTSQRGNYTNIQPYTNIEVSIPPFNIVSIDTMITQHASNIAIAINIDMPTGVGVMEIFANNILVARESAQIGVPIQLSQVSRDYMSTVKQATHGITDTISNLIKGDVAGVINSFVDGAIGTAEAYNRPIQSSTGENGTLALFIYPPKMFTKFNILVDDDLVQNGRPLCKIRKPKNLGGYMLVQDADVQLIATSEEIASVKSFMQGGFHYE